MGNNLNKLGIKTITLSSKTICDLLHSSPCFDIISDTSVYYILCKDCKLKYIGKTLRNVQKCIYKHRRDIRLGDLINALLLHISKTDHNFDLNAATVLAHIHNKRLRQIFEVGAISFFWSVNICPSFFFNISLLENFS